MLPDSMIIVGIADSSHGGQDHGRERERERGKPIVLCCNELRKVADLRCIGVP